MDQSDRERARLGGGSAGGRGTARAPAPGEGTRLLDLAVRLFDETGDLTGAVIASIRRIIALYHAGDRAAVRPALNELIPRYDRLRALAADSGLPSWNGIAVQSAGLGTDAATGGAWDGWLRRLAACTAALEGQRHEPPGRPAELDLSPAPKRRQLPAEVNHLLSKAGTILMVLWAVVFYIGGGAWVGRLVLGALGWHPAAIVGWAVGAVAILSALAAVGVLATLLASPLANLIGRHFRLATVVEPLVPAAGSVDEVLVSTRIQATRMKRVAFRWPYLLPLWPFSVSKRRTVTTMPPCPDPLLASLPPAHHPYPTVGAEHACRRTRIPDWAPGDPRCVGGGAGTQPRQCFRPRDCSLLRQFPRLPDPQSRPVTAARPSVTVLCAPSYALFAEEGWEEGGISRALPRRGLRQV